MYKVSTEKRQSIESTRRKNFLKTKKRKSTLKKRRFQTKESNDATSIQENKYNSVTARDGNLYLNAPRICSWNDNFSECMEFIEKIREWSRTGDSKFIKRHSHGNYNSLGIDFSDTKEISPPFALVVAAEISILKKTQNVDLVDGRINKWEKNVQKLLSDLGFFTAIEVKYKTESKIPHYTTYGFQEISRNQYSGTNKMSDEFVSKVDNLLEGKINREQIYDGVVEAINNVMEHAYDGEKDEDTFWMTAIHDENLEELTIIIFDRGRGIPNSMKKSPKWIENLGIRMEKSTDKNLLKKAFREGTRTQKTHRGNGIPNMMEVIKGLKTSGNRLRIYSGKARGIYNGYNTRTHKLEHNIKGTLVEWKLKI